MEVIRVNLVFEQDPAGPHEVIEVLGLEPRELAAFVGWDCGVTVFCPDPGEEERLAHAAAALGGELRRTRGRARFA
jgi:hypothetical protein